MNEYAEGALHGRVYIAPGAYKSVLKIKFDPNFQRMSPGTFKILIRMRRSAEVYSTYLQDKPRGLRFIRPNIFVGLCDVRIAKKIGCGRHIGQPSRFLKIVVQQGQGLWDAQRDEEVGMVSGSGVAARWRGARCRLVGQWEVAGVNRDFEALSVVFLDITLKTRFRSVKLLIASQHVPGLRCSLNIDLDILEAPDYDESIIKFIKVRAADIKLAVPECTEALRIRVEESLQKRPGNSFLWVGCVMSELSSEDTPPEIEDSLPDFPTSLRPLYDRLLGQIQP
jgi:hypothetical protein